MGKIAELINKETQIKNETKRMTVIIRKLCLSFTVLSVTNLILNIFFLHSLKGALMWVGMIIADALTLVVSYRSSKNTVLTVFVVQKGIWILASIMLYGWEGGFQFFLILLTVLFSFVEAGYSKKKLIFNFACFALFTFFLLFFKGKPSVISIEGFDKTIQILNTLVFCVCLGFVSTSFSKTSQENEEKIVKYNEQLKMEAGQDALTGLKNRRSTSEFINGLVDGNATFSICLCDIDYFKKVNDTYGHEFGDEVLKAIADVFKKTASGNACISRWGGEEFLLIFPNLNGDDAYMKVHDIREEVKKTVIPNGENNVSVTMTYGLTEYNLNKNLIENIKEVDEKLYMGKQAGRDRIVY
ncbi:MAG: GGDEF domain-containing protein [Lachnospiraceae bacterium]|nr:GGDEF domain-containing protein [Lachnospiraceae bacterium]